MTKVPWQTGAIASKHVFIASAPGKCISIYQFQSTQVDFIAQIKGKLTKQRFTAATVFVDHFSRICYVYLMCNLLSNKTIQAICVAPWRCNLTLSLQQWLFCGQSVCLPLQKQTPDSHLLWCQRSFSEWHCQESHF